jgi:hypothetical protein
MEEPAWIRVVATIGNGLCIIDSVVRAVRRRH